jgi:hypothetical protein
MKDILDVNYRFVIYMCVLVHGKVRLSVHTKINLVIILRTC